MFKFKIFFLIIIYTLFVFNKVNSNEIVFIDVDILFSQSKKGKKIILGLNDLNKKNENQLKNKEEQILIIKGQIESQRNILKKEELDKKINEFNNIVNDFNQLKSTLIKNYQDQKDQELKEFFNSIAPLLEKYMDDKSIKIIFDKKNIFLANKKFDATSDIIKIIDNNF